MPGIITLTTDFGSGSPYVAQMKGVLLSIDASLKLIDVTHSIAPQNVRQAALVLADVCDRFPAGTIHVAVVDPGVGTARRMVYCRVGEQVLLGPDNGLFSRITRRTPPTTIIALEDPQFWLPKVSATFHGRDILAPVAARLCQGLDPRQLGPPVERLVELDWPEPRVSAESITGEIIAVDSFGNAITNIGDEHLLRLPDQNAIKVARPGSASMIPLVRTYGDGPRGTPVALVGSGGLLEIAIVDGSAARELGLAVGDRVEVRGD
jgi:S-adenosylmethionine hydrolase